MDIQRQKAFAFAKRTEQIDRDEFSTGFYTNENPCQRVVKHIRMIDADGDRLNEMGDFLRNFDELKCNDSKYIQDMRAKYKHTLAGGRRRINKSKYRKSGKSRKSRKSRKSGKSRRH